MKLDAALRLASRQLGDIQARHRNARSLEEFAKYEGDPVGFLRDVLNAKPWEAQERIARAIVEKKRVVVRSCNSAGKDWLAARLSLWWVYARRGFVIVTGPTERQVREIVFGEIRAAFRSVADLPGDLYEQALRVDREGRVGVLGFTSSDASRLTGFHAPRLLVILTEAQGVEEHAWEGMFACATGDDSAVLAVGNPLSPDGTFYRVSNSSDWTAIRIRATDHPNIREGREVIPGGISPSWVDLMRKTYGPDSPIYRSRVEGEFPDSAEDSLIPRSWIDAAIERYRSGEMESGSQSRVLVFSLDVARFGPDRTVLLVRQGPVVREIIRWGRSDTMATVGRAITAIGRSKWRCDSGAVLIVDEPGVGGGVLDRFREQLSWNLSLRCLRRIEGFHGGKRPRRGITRFFNRRAEAFWLLRERFESGDIAIPDDPDLVSELSAIRWTVNSAARIQLERKDDIRARIGSSPDLADALAMAFWAEADVGPAAAMISV